MEPFLRFLRFLPFTSFSAVALRLPLPLAVAAKNAACLPWHVKSEGLSRETLFLLDRSPRRPL
jgi:hypothetical protein